MMVKRYTLLMLIIIGGLGSTYAQHIDSLLKLLPVTGADTSKVWMFRDLAFYYQSELPDSAMYYGQKGYELAKAIKHDEGMLWNLYQVALAWEGRNELDSAITVYGEALKLADQLGLYPSKAKLLNALGVANYYGGRQVDAIHWYTRSYEVADSIGYREGVAHALNNLGVIYRLRRRYDRALDVYHASLNIKREDGDRSGMVNSLYNIGLAHAYLNDFEQSLEYLHQARSLAESLRGLEVDVANIDVGIGVALYHLERYEEARAFLLEGARVTDRIKNPEAYAALTYLGAIEVASGDHASGLAKIEESYEAVSQIGRKELLKRIAFERAQAATRTRNFERAAESWAVYNELAEELLTESAQWAHEELQARFELKDKEVTIARQLLNLEAEEARTKRYLISAGFLVALLLLSAMFLRFFLVQNRRLKIEMGLKEKALVENSWLFQELHHRTRNNLQLLSSLLNLKSRSTKVPEARIAIESSRDTVGAIGLLHQRLHAHESTQKVAFHHYIDDLFQYFQMAFSLNDRNIELGCECDEIELDIDTAIPLGLVINELLTNAIKYAFPNGEGGRIKLRLKKSEKGFIVEVEDNGVGFSEFSEHGSGTEMISILSRKLASTFEYITIAKGTLARFIIP